MTTAPHTTPITLMTSPIATPEAAKGTDAPGTAAFDFDPPDLEEPDGDVGVGVNPMGPVSVVETVAAEEAADAGRKAGQAQHQQSILICFVRRRFYGRATGPGCAIKSAKPPIARARRAAHI